LVLLEEVATATAVVVDTEEAVDEEEAAATIEAVVVEEDAAVAEVAEGFLEPLSPCAKALFPMDSANTVKNVITVTPFKCTLQSTRLRNPHWTTKPIVVKTGITKEPTTTITTKAIQLLYQPLPSGNNPTMLPSRFSQAHTMATGDSGTLQEEISPKNSNHS